jgi:hypothetical protein
MHDPSNRFIENGGPTGNHPTLLSEYRGFNWISLLGKLELLNWLALAENSTVIESSKDDAETNR